MPPRLRQSLARTFAALPLAAVAVLVTTLLSAPGTASAAAPATPRVGDCHQLTAREGYAYSDPDPPVRCSSRHTSRTIEVVEVPADIDLVGRGDRDLIQSFGGATCGQAARRVTQVPARDRLLSAYTVRWFVPTPAEARAGQRWLRCDLVLIAGLELAPLPDDEVPALGRAPHPDSEARCHQGRRQNYLLTVCSRPHQYRARGTFTLPGKAYPGRRKRAAAAERRCPRITGSRAWLVHYPSEAGWTSGSAAGRLFVCSEKTRR